MFKEVIGLVRFVDYQYNLSDLECHQVQKYHGMSCDIDYTGIFSVVWI